MNINRQILLSLLSGVLLFLSFPKYGEGIAAWFALAPLLYSLRYGTVKVAAITGFIAGSLFYAGLLYWITIAVVDYGRLPPAAGILTMLGMAAYLALYVALFAAGVAYLRERGLGTVIAAPLLWTCLEYGKSHLLTGFPWENLAYSQYLYTPLIQIADITGIYGLSFAIVLVNSILADVLSFIAGGFEKSDGQGLLAKILCGILIVISLFAYGGIRIKQIGATLKGAPAFGVALIQGNIDQSIKWNPRYQDETLQVYKSLSAAASPFSPGMIVWPETAVPFYFQEMEPGSREVVRVAKTAGNWLLFGSPSYIRENGALAFFNSAYLVSPEGTAAGRYDKVHLVPYGEYVPLRRFFPFVGKLVEGEGDFVSGRGHFPLPMDSRKVGVLICYEAIFPESSRNYKRMGADLLVNITNDAWFGKSSAPYQHLSMTVFRAVENRLYLLRSANAGISAIIDPTGEIIAQTPLFIASFLKGEARFIDKRTYYVAYGDTFAYLCLISLFFVILKSFIRRKKCWKK